MFSNLNNLRKIIMNKIKETPLKINEIDNNVLIAQRTGTMESNDSSGKHKMTIKNGLLAIDFDGKSILRNSDINTLEFVTSNNCIEIERVKYEALQLVEDFNLEIVGNMGQFCTEVILENYIYEGLGTVLDNIAIKCGESKTVVQGDAYYSTNVFEKFMGLWSELETFTE